MSDQDKINELAAALDAGDWQLAHALARGLAARCDRAGVLSLRPLEVWGLLTAIADLVDELDEGGIERVEDDGDGDDDSDEEE